MQPFWMIMREQNKNKATILNDYERLEQKTSFH